ncbi:hypothetical protein S40293_07813 [Stachybotrys chartarum IBT 40293]|nr:hypothetical protein S40293_07813 [Stachybotrys chartarum IBT 40293]
MTLYSSMTPTSNSDGFNEIGATTMRLIYFSNEFPHDDLHKHFRFLQEATLAVKDEVKQLPSPLKAQIPPFESILDFAHFADLRRSRPFCESINGVLLCTLEIGTYIGFYEEYPWKHTAPGAKTCVAGLGIGLLASTAVAISSHVSDLPLAGAQVIRQAFRLGVLVDEVSNNLFSASIAGPGSPESWAYVFPDVTAVDVQQELDAVHTRERTPEASKIFISAVNASSVTISGSPARLRALLRVNDFFRDRKSFPLAVYGGLCHAEHIYNRDHVRTIVHTPTMAQMDKDSRFSPYLPVYSTGKGKPYPAESASSLFEHIIEEILTQVIRWDSVIEGLIHQAQSTGADSCELVVFRMSLPINDFKAALKKLSGVEVFSQELVPWVQQDVQDTPNTYTEPQGPAQSKIAIVGMSCRMPGGATDTEKFWQLLESGLDVHRKIPADRFDVASHYDPEGKRVNASHTPYGCFIEEPGLFDAPFFNMSPREAQQTDPMQRLAIVTAYEALERAGYVANRTASTKLERIGTFYGQASDDYREVNTAQDISTYFIPGGCRAFGPGRINYFFKFAGPSYSIDTACSSSLATIQSACTALWSGELDTAVVGGMNVLTNSDAFAGLSHGHFLSKTPNACKTWDKEADGYCRADGVASLVMKRLEDAQADRDNILGVIVSAATNHSANAISITHPHAGHQAYLGRLILNRAGVDPLDVGYVEMHGTGTQAGDAEEIESVAEIYAPQRNKTGRHRSAKNPLYIGAVKANVGHGEAVAGVTAVVKVLMMLQKNMIPQHVGIKNSLNPKFPKFIGNDNIRIPYENTPWHRPAEGKKRIAVVNNFSAAGGNSSVVLEDGPLTNDEPGTKVVDPRPTHVVAVSAKSKISLRGNIERLLEWLKAHSDVSLQELAYTTTARRQHHNYRIAFTASDAEQVSKNLEAALASVENHNPISSSHGPPPVAFVFTGQGASFKSYHLELFHQSPYFQAQVVHLDKLAQGQGFPSFVPVLDGSYAKDHAHPAILSQLALVCVQIALVKYWAVLGIRPDVVVGHSLGEYAALYTAGVLSASDVVYLVGQRARQLEQKCEAGSYKMVAVRASLEQIQDSLGTCDTPWETACLNGPKETVLSGMVNDMETVSQILERDSYKCFTLELPFAFHSAQTDPVLDDFEALATSGVVFQPPQMPVISPLLNKVIFDEKTLNGQYLRRATRETVNFRAALETAHQIGTLDDETVYVEIGPHPVCLSFVKSTLGSATSRVAISSLRRGENNWTTIGNSAATLHNIGFDVHWNEFHAPFERGLNLLDLPTYAWNNKTYWLQYNGDWALTKGNHFYDEEKGIGASAKSGKSYSALKTPVSSLKTSTVQSIIEEHFQQASGRVIMQSDLSHPEFRAAAWGHKMNNCGVVTSSIHADIAFTLGDYLYKKLRPRHSSIGINMTHLGVLKGLVANQDPSIPQVIQVEASAYDLDINNTAELTWYNVHDGVVADEPFASATLIFENTSSWLTSWVPLRHLVEARIQDLERLAEAGQANRLSNNMAYQLFASNLVDYASVYRGMQSVVLDGLEAFADVTLTTESSQIHAGSFTVPPHFIDSVCHLAGFVMNVSDALDTAAKFSVTPGWRTMRFAKPLLPGGKFRSYVKMIVSDDDPNKYFGDVYILQSGQIIGMVEGIQFSRYPRILLSRFFSAPDDSKAPPVAHASKGASTSTKKKATPIATTAVTAAAKKQIAVKATETSGETDKVTQAAKEEQVLEDAVAGTMDAELGSDTKASTPANANSTTAKAVQLIAAEAGLDLADLTNGASFAELGIDSLMSLVIAEKFREQLGVVVNGSLFLEYPTIGDLRGWLDEYYS